MPEQRIDLLPKKYRKVVIQFGHQKVLMLTGLSTLLVCAISGFVAYLDVQLAREIEFARGQGSEIALVLDEYRTNNSKKVLDETIAVRIQKYENLLRQRQHFLRKLDGESFGNTQGFSEYLLALSRQKFPNIWIEDLIISGNGEGFSIKGKSVSPADITVYLKSLQDEPAMNGIIFDNLELSREAHPKGDFITFTVSYGDVKSIQDTGSSVMSGFLAGSSPSGFPGR